MLINNLGVNSVYVPILGEKYFVYASLMKMQGISRLVKCGTYV